MFRPRPPWFGDQDMRVFDEVPPVRQQVHRSAGTSTAHNPARASTVHGQDWELRCRSDLALVDRAGDRREPEITLTIPGEGGGARGRIRRQEDRAQFGDSDAEDPEWSQPIRSAITLTGISRFQCALGGSHQADVEIPIGQVIALMGNCSSRDRWTGVRIGMP